MVQKRKQIPVPKYEHLINACEAFNIKGTFPLEMMKTIIISERYNDILKKSKI